VQTTNRMIRTLPGWIDDFVEKQYLKDFDKPI